MSSPVALPDRSRRLTSLLLAVVVALSLLVVDSALAKPASATLTPAGTLVAKMNAARTAAGLRAYVVRSDLNAVAQAQAARMAASHTLYHNPSLTTAVKNWQWVGENVGYAPDALTLHAAFMASPGHRANVLDRDFTEVGVGYAWSGGTLWASEVFRKPLHATTTTTAKRHPYLHLGSRGMAVRRVQTRLHQRRTGYYSRRTRAAVRRFQRSHHLRVTGTVNTATWRALGI
jgi:hypothetical protein